MASGRIIHKDLFLNEDLSELSIDERFLYVGTVVFSDDDGRMKASLAYLKASIFPLDIKLPIEKIKLWRDNLANKKLIGIYSAGGKEYIYHPNWTKWQSLRKDRYHPSDCPCPDDKLPLGNHLATTWQPSATEPNLTKPNLTEQVFETFCKDYPKPVNIAIAYQVFKASIKTEEDFKVLMVALKNYKDSDEVKKRMIKNADNWLMEWKEWLKTKLTTRIIA